MKAVKAVDIVIITRVILSSSYFAVRVSGLSEHPMIRIASTSIDPNRRVFLEIMSRSFLCISCLRIKNSACAVDYPGSFVAPHIFDRLLADQIIP